MTGCQKNIVDNEAMIVQGYCQLNLLALTLTLNILNINDQFPPLILNVYNVNSDK